MAFLFNEIIYRPIYNLLVLLYNNVSFSDFGIAIILATVFIKFLLIPLSKKQIESQKKMQELQPKIKALQAKHKNDKEKQSRALMELYKENKANPLSGCLPLIVQLIFLIAIYRVLFNISNAGLTIDNNILYPFISNPGQINQDFLGIIDLSSVVNLGSLALKDLPHILLVVFAAGAQYFQSKMLMSATPSVPAKENKEGPDLSQMMNKQMLYLGPAITLFIGLKFPAGLALYWLVSTVFMIVQQYYLTKSKKAETVQAK